jgi:hypothetical protein
MHSYRIPFNRQRVSNVVESQATLAMLTGKFDAMLICLQHEDMTVSQCVAEFAHNYALVMKQCGLPLNAIMAQHYHVRYIQFIYLTNVSAIIDYDD